jgi:pimeloyl-ACP methyl ester carboxylesterase
MGRRSVVGLAVFVVVGYGAWGQFGSYLGFQVEGRYFETPDGIRLHYTDQGAGEPIVLLHGYAMNQDLSWRDGGIIDDLARDYRVIALDFRGHGRSGKPHDPSAYGMEMAEDVIRLLDHLGIARAHLLGKSMGAAVALAVTVKYPERVISAIPTAMGWVRPWGANQAAQVALAESLEQGGGFDPLLRRLWDDGEDPGWLNIQLANVVVGRFNDKVALAKLTARLTEMLVSEAALRRNTVPTLTIIGSRDPLVEDAEAQARVMARHELVVIEGAGHFYISRSPEYMDHVRRFLAEQGTASVWADAA